MPFRRIIIALLAVLCLWGCAERIPRGVLAARTIMQNARQNGADILLPDEYANAEDTLQEAESLLQQDQIEDAEQYFLFAWQKGELLLNNLEVMKNRITLETQRNLAAAKAESERLKAIEAALDKAKAEKERAASKELEQNKPTKPVPEKERPLPLFHTVRRGETLPQIASRQDVYSDAALWPILYRANRDQIKDPRFIWPGQILRIPRTIDRDDIAEAHRYAQEKPLP